MGRIRQEKEWTEKEGGSVPRVGKVLNVKLGYLTLAGQGSKAQMKLGQIKETNVAQKTQGKCRLGPF